MLDSVRASRDDRRMVLGPPQRQAVLMTLLLNAGRTVRPEQLVDAVWDERPPEKAPATLQAHVSALRKALEPEREPHAPSRVIRSADHGYLVDPEDVDVDVFRFQRDVAEADRARERCDLARAADLLRSALATFKAVALPGVPGPFAVLHRDMLGEQRLTAYQDLVELDLLGHPGEHVDHDLTELLAEHPHRERLHGLHMRVLHHNGRRADALAAYATARRTLVDDLGIEPGVELRRLHERMLAGDATGPVTAPRLVVTRRSVAADEPGFGRPPRQPLLLGRDDVLAELVTALTEPAGRTAPVVVLHGIAGIGKTATAAWVAHTEAGRFPGGQFLLPADADDEHRAAVLRRAERGGRALLILDDVTTISDVRPALPTSNDVAVLITSRYRGKLLPFARQMELPPLPARSAHELFCRVVGRQRTDREPAAVERLAAAAAGVPSVLLSLAELLCRRPEWSIVDYTSRLAERGDWSMDMHLRPLFDRSYAELDPLLAKVFRMAAVHPDEALTASSVAELTRWPVDQVQLLLEELVDHNMLDSVALGRYAFPPLLRHYGMERASQLEAGADFGAAQRRLTTVPDQRATNHPDAA